MMAATEVDVKRSPDQTWRGGHAAPRDHRARVDPEGPTAVEIPIRRPPEGTRPPALPDELPEESTAIFERRPDQREEDDDSIIIVFADDDPDTAVDVVIELSDEDTETVTDVDEAREESDLDTMLVLVDDDGALTRPSTGDPESD
jgi:hypothetical protein